jgi:hypothetical protein
MEEIASFATTPEGQRLGELAAGSLRIVVEPRPWWAFPAEPWHWFMDLSSVSAHSFHAAAFYLFLSTLVALAAARRWGGRTGLAWLITLMMTLVGGMQADCWLYTKIPSGIRWLSPPGAPYRLANLHCHSQASGGSLMPEDLLSWHLDKGYTVVAITDSNKTYPALRAAEEARRRQLPIVVVGGEEYRGTTHLLMLNLREAIRADRVPIEQAIAQAKAQGAVVIGAHIWTGQHSAAQLLQWGVAGFEVSNGRTLAAPETLELCRQGGLAALGTLDYRQGNSPRTATVLPPEANTPERVLAALQEGHCAALYVPEWAEPTRFSVSLNLHHRLDYLRETGQRLIVPGLMFWAALAWLASRWIRPRPLRSLGWIVAVAGLCGCFGLWSVWWKFKFGWFPRLELALLIWVVACPLCAYLSCCEGAAYRARQRLQQPVEVV